MESNYKLFINLVNKKHSAGCHAILIPCKPVQISFNARFWNEQAGLYYDYDVRAGRSVQVNTEMIFMPLVAGLADQTQADRLVADHLLNPAEYAPGGRVRFWVTSVSQTEPAWEARRYWRGPVWIITNWLIADGLQRYGYAEIAAAIRRELAASAA